MTKILATESMSPTLRAVLAATTVRDAAVRAAWEAEGTSQEAEANAAEDAAEAAYREAVKSHRAACDASRAQRRALGA